MAPSERTILLVTTAAGRQIVFHGCHHAARAGVRPGMTLAQARAMLPAQNLLVAEHDPQRDARALNALAHWALRFSPLVTPDPPDGLFIDVTGCDSFFRGERRLAHLVHQSITRLRFATQLAIASTAGCAWAVARFTPGPVTLVQEDALTATLAPLPVAALRLNDQTSLALHEVGLRQIGQVLAIPRAGLLRRYGPELLHRLDQALGHVGEVLEPVRPLSPLVVDQQFAGPTTQFEAMLLSGRQLVDQLVAELHQQHAGVRELVVRLGRVYAEPVEMAIHLSRPSRDPKHLWSLLYPRLERANMGEGVERVTLTARQVGRLRHEQAQAWPQMDAPARMDQRLGEMIDTLVNRLGPERVTRIEPVASHVPEWAFIHRSVLAPPAKVPAEQTASERPTVLLPTPESIDVVSLWPDGPLTLVRWRGHEHPIQSTIGPERIGPAWWKVSQPSGGSGASGGSGGDSWGGLNAATTGRDYYRVQDDAGRWLWVFRQVDANRWWLHGLWA